MSGEIHSSPADENERDEQLQAVIAEYIRSSEARRPPVRQDLLNQYPEFAAELKQFFVQRDQMNRLADPIRAFNDDLFEAVGPGRQLSYVGNYELLEEVARGGMGVVYKARQTTLGRIVAVKMIVTGQLANELDVQRFQSEAQAAAGLHHPHIVAIHEVGQHDGWHYFSMDYVEGQDLATILRINLLSARTAATYVRQMAEAIHYAHQQGILHRDLKPSNILVDCTNQIHITDFGLAMRVEGDQGLTQTGQILGTPSYMPPEQAQCKRAFIGPASDVYSLGAILYECLTGRPPFRAESVINTIEQVIHADAASPRTLNASVPRDLETICLKCLEKEPHRRYGTAQLLQEDLGRFLSGEPIVARPARALERTVKWIRRRPAISALLLLLVSSILAGSVASTLFALLAAERAESETRQRVRAVEGERLAVAAEREQRRLRTIAEERERDLKWRVYVGQMHAMTAAWRDSQFGQLARLLQQTTPAAHETDLRGWEWHFLHGQLQEQVAILPGEKKYGPAVNWNRKTNLLAVVDDKNQIEIWEPDTLTRLRTLPPLPDSPLRIAWSEGGEWIAAACEATRTVFLVDSRDGTVRQSWPLQGAGRLSDLVWRPGHNHVTVATFQGQVSLLDAEQVEPIRTFHKRDPEDFIGAIAWTHDGLRLAIGGRFGWLRLYDPDKETMLWEQKHRNGVVQGLAWSPVDDQLAVAISGQLLITIPNGELKTRLAGTHNGDVKKLEWAGGNRLVSAAGDHTVKVWNVSMAKSIRTIQVHAGQVMGLAVSPDGLRVASTGEDQSVKFSQLVSPQVAAHTSGHIPNRINDIAFNSDSTRLASVGWDQTTRIWDVSNGQPLLALKHHSTNTVLDAVAWSVDDAQLAVIDRAGHMAMLDSETGQRLMDRSLGKTGPACLAWSHDGKTFAVTFGVTEQTVLWNAHTLNPVVKLKDNGAHFLAWSPDDCWLATVNGDGLLRIWHTGTGEPRWSQKFGADEHIRIAWRSDGRVIAASGRSGDVLLYDPDDPTRTLGRCQGHRGAANAVAWLHDGSRLATCGIDGTIRIWDAVTLDLLLTLSDGNETPLECIAWSPDGAVIAAGDSLGRLQFWKLPKAAPAAATKRKRAAVASPPKGAAETYNKLGGVLFRQAKFEAAIESYEESLRIRPVSASAQNNLAWVLAVCPESHLRNGKRAVELAQQAVGLAPQSSSYWNTLGTAHLRAGSWQAAIDAVQRSEQLDPRGFAFGHNSFILAMAHSHLGNDQEARDWYGQAINYTANQKRAVLEDDGRGQILRSLEHEAAELLKIDANE